MEIDKENFEVADPIVEGIYKVSADVNVRSRLMDKTDDENALLQMDALCRSPNNKLDAQPIEVDALIVVDRNVEIRACRALKILVFLRTVDALPAPVSYRAVAKCLQTLLDKEPAHGKKVVGMDSLLNGKTRKEASRMFFETLVLKTRDYIHVEQAKPFDNVSIRSRFKDAPGGIVENPEFSWPIVGQRVYFIAP
ncbi:hypothetical protein D8674_040965 [Pyrus ussuriensis x Pyrus communis]|uniref:Rad21/Rec8-like protein C-terminal eukaryotic domain-containing protein n=1 Tax=Pyrus ussuriensis x Pyrus communis TaxID=2448454 RepID=A0A5N5FFL5_9ROSA|nr:hypothetical protein D8674_041038 [Pyrus ussuriensis x Pyrus communis]KAB2604002.1 hypothetical protein D8674_040965 [Pyrus ussuriensis x Pyrus communis]